MLDANEFLHEVIYVISGFDVNIVIKKNSSLAKIPFPYYSPKNVKTFLDYRQHPKAVRGR